MVEIDMVGGQKEKQLNKAINNNPATCIIEEKNLKNHDIKKESNTTIEKKQDSKKSENDNLECNDNLAYDNQGEENNEETERKSIKVQNDETKVVPNNQNSEKKTNEDSEKKIDTKDETGTEIKNNEENDNV